MQYKYNISPQHNIHTQIQYKYNIFTQIQYNTVYPYKYNVIFPHTHTFQNTFTSLHLFTHNTTIHVTSFIYTLHFTPLHLFTHNTSLHFTSFHLYTLKTPLEFPLLVTTFLTLFLKMFNLQGKDASKSAGSRFQFFLMVLFTNEYLPTSVLCFLVLIFLL
jgi:hypothetical protein